MENKNLKIVEQINKDFEAGIPPAKLTAKYGFSKHRLGSLAKLLGYRFSNAPVTNLFEWVPVRRSRRTMTLGNRALGSPNPTRFKVLEHDAKNKRIVVLYE